MNAARPADRIPVRPIATAERAQRRRVMLLLLLAALLAHVGFVPGEPGSVFSARALSYDDPQVLALADERSVARLLTEVTYFAYKPLYFLSLKLDRLFSDGPGFAHAVNLLLFLCCVAVLHGLLLDLTRSAFVAGAAALLFAVHPVHVESVAWIAGRKDVLSLLFVLLAHRAYRRARQAPSMGAGVSWGAAGLLLLGGLTKGTVWTYAGVLALDEALTRWRGAGRPGVAWRLLPVLLVALGGLVADVLVGRAYGPGAVEHDATGMQLLAAMAGVHLAYVGSLVSPVGLSLDYAVRPDGSWSQPGALLGAALTLLVLAGMALSLKRARPLLALALGLWLLGLGPVNNLWPRTTTLMADRYLLLAALGPYLLAAALLARAGAARGALLGALALALGLLCIHRTRTFFDSGAVWADATAKRPESALAWIHAGLTAAEGGSFPAALDASARAVALAPRDELLVKAHLLRCAALLGLGRVEELLAESGVAGALSRSLAQRLGAARLSEARGVESEAEVFRGQALEALGEEAGALAAYRRAAQLDGENPVAHYNLGTLLSRPEAGQRTLEPALQHLRLARGLARRLRPGLQLTADLQYATVLAMAGHAEEALRWYDEAEREHGRTPELLLARAQHHLATGRAERALADLAVLRREHPDHPKAARMVYDLYVGDGQRLLKEGRKSRDKAVLEQALRRFTEAAQLERSWTDAWLGAGDALYEAGRLLEARERYRQASAAAPQALWIRALVARATTLEAAFTARHAEQPGLRRAAAERMAEALAEGTPRLDLGVVPLEAELPALRRVAATLAEGSPTTVPLAEGVLLAAALLAAGDDARAERELARVLNARPADAGAPEVLEAALFLRAGVYERTSSEAALREAENDYAALARLRPLDAAPRLRGLEVARKVRSALAVIARGRLPDPDTLARARERVAGVQARPAGAPELTADGQAAYAEALEHVAAAERVEQVEAVAREASQRLVEFADAHPENAQAGLLAVEREMGAGQWVPALKRLNALVERFPEDPSVLRGQAFVYVNQFQTVRDQRLLLQALQVLQRAVALDPRDPRTALDVANAKIARGELQAALAWAQRAATYENLPGGPAAQKLAFLTVAMGSQALEQGDEPAVRAAIESARRQDPGSPASFLLEARLLLERTRDPNKALVAAMRAAELRPGEPEVSALLSRIHYQRGVAGHLIVHGLREPEPPSVRDPTGWAKATPAQRTAATTAHEQALVDVRARREAARARAIQDLDAALRYDPRAEHAEQARAKLDGLRRSDPEEQRARLKLASDARTQGVGLLETQRYLEAYEAFERALAANPGDARAAFFLVESGYRRLAGGTLSDERRREVTNRCYECLQLLDKLDPGDEFPLRHLYRGLVNEHLWQRSQQDDARRSAVAAYRHYLDVAVAHPGEREVDLRQARERLAELEREDR